MTVNLSAKFIATNNNPFKTREDRAANYTIVEWMYSHMNPGDYKFNFTYVGRYRGTWTNLAKELGFPNYDLGGQEAFDSLCVMAGIHSINIIGREDVEWSVLLNKQTIASHLAMKLLHEIWEYVDDQTVANLIDAIKEENGELSRIRAAAILTEAGVNRLLPMTPRGTNMVREWIEKGELVLDMLDLHKLLEEIFHQLDTEVVQTEEGFKFIANP